MQESEKKCAVSIPAKIFLWYFAFLESQVSFKSMPFEWFLEVGWHGFTDLVV